MKYDSLDMFAIRNASYLKSSEISYLKDCSKIINKFSTFVNNKNDCIDQIDFKITSMIEKDIIYGGEPQDKLRLMMISYDENRKYIENETSKEAFRSLMAINYLTPHILNLKEKQSITFTIHLKDNPVETLAKNLLGEELNAKLEYLDLKSKLTNSLAPTAKRNKI